MVREIFFKMPFFENKSGIIKSLIGSFCELDISQLEQKDIEDEEFGPNSPYVKQHQSLINKFNILIEGYLVKKCEVDEMI